MGDNDDVDFGVRLLHDERQRGASYRGCIQQWDPGGEVAVTLSLNELV